MDMMNFYSVPIQWNLYYLYYLKRLNVFRFPLSKRSARWFRPTLSFLYFHPRRNGKTAHAPSLARPSAPPLPLGDHVLSSAHQRPLLRKLLSLFPILGNIPCLLHDAPPPTLWSPCSPRSASGPAAVNSAFIELPGSASPRTSPGAPAVHGCHRGMLVPVLRSALSSCASPSSSVSTIPVSHHRPHLSPFPLPA
jgi:hypothetical protein